MVIASVAISVKTFTNKVGSIEFFHDGLAMAWLRSAPANQMETPQWLNIKLGKLVLHELINYLFSSPVSSNDETITVGCRAIDSQ